MDTDTTEWKKQDVTGYGVKGRRSHCAACIGNSVIYFGGYNATTKEHFGDVFIVNIGRLINAGPYSQLFEYAMKSQAAWKRGYIHTVLNLMEKF